MNSLKIRFEGSTSNVDPSQNIQLCYKFIIFDFVRLSEVVANGGSTVYVYLR